MEEIAAGAAGARAAAADLDALERVETSVFGRKSRLGEIRQKMGALVDADKPTVGRALGETNARLREAVDARRAELESSVGAGRLAVETLDLTLPGRRRRLGHRHLVTRVIDEFCDVFRGMGYCIAEGPEVETDYYNFEALNMPVGHPARSMWDTLYVAGESREESERLLLRTHTSPVQIRLMEKSAPPIRHVMPGRTFRRDTLDPTHSPVFHQVEGLAVDHDVTFGDMAGTLERFCHEYFGAGVDIRLHPDFFPFTEPSAGIEVWWKDRWLEIAGCGMVDPNVLGHVGYDTELWQGFAFGFGVERVAMLRYGIDDIRVFFENDVRFLEQF